MELKKIYILPILLLLVPMIVSAVMQADFPESSKLQPIPSNVIPDNSYNEVNKNNENFSFPSGQNNSSTEAALENNNKNINLKSYSYYWIIVILILFSFFIFAWFWLKFWLKKKG